MTTKVESGRGSWRRWTFAATGAVAVLLAAGFVVLRAEDFLIHDPRFLLRQAESTGGGTSADLRIHGLFHSPKAPAEAVFARDFNRSVYLLPLAERRRNLLAVDWVKNASVARIWPNRVEVRIEERRPVAFAELPSETGGGPYQVALVDEEGVILEPPERSQYSLPILTGLRRQQSLATRRERVRRMLRLLEDVGPLAEKISEIDVSDAASLRVSYPVGDRVFVLILANDGHRGRLQNFLTHYGEIRRRLPNATTLDLRLADRITAVEETPDER